jgi:transposase
MAEANQETGCPKCAELQAKAAGLEARVAALEAELAKARKHSGNSSKPPSSDIVQPPRPKKRGRPRRRRIGGQPGHPRHQRRPFSPDQLDEAWIWYHESSPCCDAALEDVPEQLRTLQQVELLPQAVHTEEHRSIAQRCVECGKVHYPAWPEALQKAGLIGPRLTALVGFLKGACHMSFGAIRKYFRDVIGVRISRGLLAKAVQKVSAALQDPYEALLAMLPKAEQLNVDETGHKEQGKRLWTWCFRAYLYTVYKISPSRSSEVLVEVLGKEFEGLLGCDYFSAYRKYMKDFGVLVQFCLAHFIRDVKFLAEHPDPRNRAHGQRLLADLRRLFGIIHRREQYASATTFRQALERARNELVWNATLESPHTREASALEERFYQHTESYFRFITEPGIAPTNNLAEQALRFVAIHRRITQGTRGEDGRRWCERIWTAIQTCGQQGRSVFEFLCAAVDAFFAGQTAPSLVPDNSS